MPSFPEGTLAAPFPWFGGKVMQADMVWQRLGQVSNYIEPFAGSLGVLLNRPGGAPEVGVETCNDADGFIANFWRASAAEPEAVARWADWPVNEADLHARHIWLNGQRAQITDALIADPDHYDVKIAGWWVWGICQWIGSGWCAGASPTQRPHISNGGMGVHRKRPQISDGGMGVHRKRPHLSDAGMGVHQASDILDALRQRMRRVRVICGDWSRAVSKGATHYGRITGVYLDPPYAVSAGRESTLYSTDSEGLSADVRAWCLANGDDPKFRIALAGYEGEHEMPESWECVEWKPHGHGMGGSAKGSSRGKDNVRRERVWFSPACLKPERRGQIGMFDTEAP